MKLFDDLGVVCKHIDGLSITIDPRLELLSALQINAEYPYLTPFSFAYENKMKDYFSKFKSHHAIKVFNQLFSKGFAYDAPVKFMLHFNDEFKDEKRPLITTEDYNEFEKAIQDYYLDSNFQTFYKDNISFYEHVISNLASQIKDSKIIERLEEFFGYSQNSYNILLSPLFINGGYGINKKINDHTFDCYAVCGALDVFNNVPLFNIKASFKGYTSEHIFTMLILHEFGHSFVNPLTDRHLSDINKYSHLYEPYAESLAQQGYGNWESFVNEQIIEAIVSKIVATYINKEDAVINLKLNRDYKNFVYINNFYDILDQYVQNRTQYPDFKEFYPKFIEMFESI